MGLNEKILARIEERGLDAARVEDFLDLSGGSSFSVRRASIYRALSELEREGRLPVPRVRPPRRRAKDMPRFRY